LVLPGKHRISVDLGVVLVRKQVQTSDPGKPGIAGCQTKEKVMSFKEKFLAFLREEEGLTTVEYAVGGTLLVVGIAAAFDYLSDQIDLGVRWIADQINTG
jgi:pilus assembly protein Flp/PilA